ncbi:MAG: hypothetical protein KDJ97_12330 [Anaerolineae bacterium]|nr:hypothetical protein [Anaerolineae bacterium]
MNQLRITKTVLSITGTLILSIVMSLVTLTTIVEASHFPYAKFSSPFEISNTSIISGTYVGTIAITELVQLGMLGLAFDLTEQEYGVNVSCQPA